MDKAHGSFKISNIFKFEQGRDAVRQARAHEIDVMNRINDTPRSQGILSMFSKPQEDQSIVNRKELLKELDHTLSELRYARSCFENACDPEIIEACVYEIKSAEARYSFLLRKAKEAGISQSHSERIHR